MKGAMEEPCSSTSHMRDGIRHEGKVIGIFEWANFGTKFAYGGKDVINSIEFLFLQILYYGYIISWDNNKFLLSIFSQVKKNFVLEIW